MELQNLFAGFNRLQDFALDPTDQYETLADLESYLTNDSRAYKGQKLVVYNDSENNGLYIIINKNEQKALQKLISENEINDLSNRVDTLTETINEFGETYTRDNVIEIIQEFNEEFNDPKYATKEELEKKFKDVFGDRDIESLITEIQSISEVLDDIDNLLKFDIEKDEISGDEDKVPSSKLVKDKFTEIENMIGALSQALLDRMDGKI